MNRESDDIDRQLELDAALRRIDDMAAKAGEEPAPPPHLTGEDYLLMAAGGLLAAVFIGTLIGLWVLK